MLEEREKIEHGKETQECWWGEWRQVELLNRMVYLGLVSLRRSQLSKDMETVRELVMGYLGEDYSWQREQLALRP